MPYSSYSPAPTKHGEGLIIESEFHTETTTAPAISAIYNTRYPALLTETLEIAGYEEGVDFYEIGNVGFQNLTIPQGTPLTLEYFTRSSPTIEELGPLANLVPTVKPPETQTGRPDPKPSVQVAGRGGSSGKVRYSQLLKMGVV